MKGEPERLGAAERGALLAFDTSSETASVGVGRDGVLIASRLLEGRTTHGRRLLPAIEELLSECGVVRGDLSGVVVGSGPGSFTGVRVAAATAKGLCHALAIPLFPVSSLLAAAWGAGPEHHDGRPRTVLFDARGDRVFAAGYRVVGNRLVEERSPVASTVDRVVTEWVESSAGVAMGDGARRHVERLRAHGWEVLPLPWGDPTADALLKVHWLRREKDPASAGGLNPAEWRPDYLKSSSASRPGRPRG